MSFLSTLDIRGPVHASGWSSRRSRTKPSTLAHSNAVVQLVGLRLGSALNAKLIRVTRARVVATPEAWFPFEMQLASSCSSAAETGYGDDVPVLETLSSDGHSGGPRLATCSLGSVPARLTLVVQELRPCSRRECRPGDRAGKL